MALSLAIPKDEEITPVNYCCLIELRPVASKTKGGIMLPEQHLDRVQYAGVHATLLAVGGNAFTDSGGEPWKGRIPRPGDKVMVKKFGGESIPDSDDRRRLCVDVDILAVGWL